MKWERKVEIFAGGSAWWPFVALQRRFRSSALPVEGIIIIRVHVYSNLRHRLQRTQLRAATQNKKKKGRKRSVSGHMLDSKAPFGIQEIFVLMGDRK